MESFEEIARRHETWLPMLRDNPKMKRILLCAYPDKAHFIYELLQNAEDARATHVEFSLYDDRLEVVHNGRDFSLEDINAITSVGQSFKDSDDTTIGQFGIGFKAVFAYTDTPEILSGTYHFLIRDMILPVAMDSPAVPAKHETKFIFPFNKGNPENTVREIENGLCSLHGDSLLFLSSIQSISCSFAGGSMLLERKDHADGITETTVRRTSGSASTSRWLRFVKKVEVEDEDKTLKKLEVALAYRLQQDEKRNWHIVPDDDAHVSIFFPAVKEYSGLKFYVHAPFASTIARDSVRDCLPNEILCEKLADLAVESLTTVRERGLLDMSFLSTLPNHKDTLGKLYLNIREKILTAFQTDSFTPAAMGGYVPAQDLIVGPKDIRDVFSDKDMEELLGVTLPVWAASAPPGNIRADSFLESLEMASWGWDDLGDVDGETYDRLHAMFEKRDDLWLMHFYSLAGEKMLRSYSLSFTDLFKNLKTDKCIRDTTGILRAPEQIFFPDDEGKALPDGIHTVKKEVLGRSEAQQKNVRAFLETLDVREYGEKSLVELTLQKYKKFQTVPTDFEEHIRDIRLFLAYARTHSFSSDVLRVDRLFYGEKGDAVFLASLPDLYLDEPFEKTGLKEIASILGKIPLSARYAKVLTREEILSFASLAKHLGVCSCISVEKIPLYYRDIRSKLYTKDHGRVSIYGREDDFTIKNLNSILELKTVSSSLLVWNALIRAPREANFAYYRRTASSPTYTEESDLIMKLKAAAWIPDKDGVFHKPQDIIPSRLHDRFIYDESNGLLAAIEFGKNFYANQEIHQKQEEAAQQIGFESAEEAAEIAKLKQALEQAGLDMKSILRDQLSRHHEQSRRKSLGEFPRGQSRDIDRHYDKAREKISDAPQKHYEVRSRSVRTSGASIDYKTYLREEYTNQEGALFCQMCQNVMPFQELEGTNYYFEGRQLLNDMAQECEANHLALCPLCAAKYKELAQRSVQAMNDLKQALRNADIEGSLEVPLSLGEKEGMVKLCFTQRHLIDIQAMLDS